MKLYLVRHAEAAFVGHEPDLGALAATFLWRTDGKGTASRLAEASRD